MMIALPFRFDPAGRVAVSDDLAEQTSGRLASIVDTMPGERVMRPTYGTTARRLVFENDPEGPSVMVSSSIQEAVKNLEPDIVLTKVSPTNIENGRVDIEVGFTLEETLEDRSARTALITVGGEVFESEER